MLSLLATCWQGDVVVFCGDYADFSKGGDHPGCKYILEKVVASGWTIPDFIYEAHDAAGRLRIAIEIDAIPQRMRRMTTTMVPSTLTSRNGVTW